MGNTKDLYHQPYMGKGFMCCSSKRVSKGSSLLGIRGSKLILDWKEVLAFLKMASLAFCKGLGFRV